MRRTMMEIKDYSKRKIALWSNTTSYHCVITIGLLFKVYQDPITKLNHFLLSLLFGNELQPESRINVQKPERTVLVNREGCTS